MLARLSCERNLQQYLDESANSIRNHRKDDADLFSQGDRPRGSKYLVPKSERGQVLWNCVKKLDIEYDSLLAGSIEPNHVRMGNGQ